jgi:hypothetical protein
VHTLSEEAMMGDGQFDGGGSVDWQVNNSDGETGGGNKDKCNGRDKDPKDPNARFRVWLNGALQFEALVKGSKIKVEW